MFRLVGADCNIDVPNDTNLLGRGPFLKVTDKRVSRNHATLVCSGERLELIPKHKNPCFFRKRGSADFVVLTKDVAQVLQDGDEFSLLPKELIYKVEKVKPTSSPTATPTDDEKPAENEPLSAGVTADKGGDGEEPAIATDKATTDEAATTTDKTTDKTTSSDSSMARKLPPWLLAAKSDVTKEEPKKKITKTTTTTAAAAKRPKPPEAAPASKRPTTTTTAAAKKDTGVKMKEDDGETTIKRKESDKDDEEHVPTKMDITKPSTSEKMTTKMDTTDSDLPPCPHGRKCYRKNPAHFKEYSHNFSDDDKDGGKEDSGEDDDRPACPYGTACYRKNPLHRKQFSHNNPPVGGTDDSSPTRASRRPKRKANKISALAGDSDDDGEPNTYDYTDSFIDDANLLTSGDSTEYGGESEDSDWAPADQEDVSELVDEAKGFASNKKMHKPV